MNNKNHGGIVLKKKHIAVIVIIILLLLIVAVVVGLNWNSWFGGGSSPKADENTSSTGTTQDFKPDIDPSAKDYQGSQPENKGGEAVGIKIPGYPSITLPADQKDVSIVLLNPEGNPCYFTFELVLKESNEVLYTSKMVPPGQSVSNITLSRALQAGEYNAVIKISTNSLENGAAMNGANVETVLIVK